MQERLLENWLISVNEKSFQIPFCQLLTGEGYQVVHMSRHGPFESGKDILAIGPDGVPCAFQLKGSTGKISQKEWAKYVDQAVRLVEIPIVHPSIDEKKPRKVFFVTNGELDEEVRLEINDRNREWERRGLPPLTTIVKGELLARFLRLHDNLWPKELVAYKDLLELYLEDGGGYLDKPKFAKFLQNVLLATDETNKAELVRSLSSLALIAQYAMHPFVEKKNHVASVEAWVIYIASLVYFVTKHDIQEKNWKANFDLALAAIDQAFSSLLDELQARRFLVEGNPMVDSPFYHGRITWLTGLISAYALWKKSKDKDWSEEKAYSFITAYQKHIRLWGEAAIPQLLSTSWFLRLCGIEHQASGLINAIARGICSTNLAPDGKGLADPYHGLAEVVINQTGLSETIQKENFKERSYALEGIIHLLTRWGWRGVLEELWPQFTKIDYVEYKTDNPWEFCLWHTEIGKLILHRPKYPQSWRELQEEADRIDLAYIPKILLEYPAVLLLFLIVYPHRITKDVIKFLDTAFMSM
ncbi:MAG: hypothetical protein FJZ87_09395 [Chloroflexi bacterium]|nr:hypothetical protein [Chloroflexota bacterium]